MPAAPVPWLSPRARSIFLVSLGAAGAGVLGGAGAVAFRLLVNVVTGLLFFQRVQAVHTPPMLNDLGWQAALVPLAGGALVALLMLALPGGPVTGGGTTEVLEAASMRGGSLPTLRTLKGVVVGGLSLGSGGSAGREGPIVQLGGLGGSWVGSLGVFGRGERRVLVACGAVAALAATFNAPIAAVVFGLEVLLLEFRTLSFVPLVISSVVGTSVGRSFLGNKPTFVLPPGLFSLTGPFDLAWYALLGLLAGGAGLLLLGLYARIEAWKPPRGLPALLVPVLGGAGIGLLGLVEPRLFGVGYETVNAVFNGALPPRGLALFLVVLLLLKPIAVSLTLRSGGSGGMFSPTFFEGALLGALFGLGLARLLPGTPIDPASFALVGMAAMFAAVSRASLTAIVLIVELTLSLDIVLPVMLACVIADLVAWTRHPSSLYAERLAAKGTPVATELGPNVLDLVLVGEVMERKVDALPATATLREYLDRSMHTDRQAFPLVDKDGLLTGIVTRTDLRTKGEGVPLDRPVAAIATRDVVAAYADETVHTAMDKMVARDIGHLPVVDRRNPRQLVGWLTRADVIGVERLRLDAGMPGPGDEG